MATITGEQKRSMIMELQKGRKTAIHLQTILKKPREHDDDDNGSLQELSLQILTSFVNILSELTASLDESTQIHAAVDCCRRKKKLPPPPGLKNRRGCYKRRRTSDSWIVESSTLEDGFAWRKYGQKLILDSQFPRCYYRCTHKSEGCKATKQVQKVKENPILYQITYLNHHTCTKTPTTIGYRNLNLHSAESKNIISFQIPGKDEDVESSKSIYPVKLENHVDDHVGEVRSDARSSTLVHDNPVRTEINTDFVHPWLEEICSGLQSCESTSLQYGMEVNQFSNEVDSFFYFDYNDKMY